MSHIRDRLIQLKNEVENTGNGAYFSKNNISKIVELLFTDLEQDEKENGWIPVSERLPETDDYILLSFANYSIPIIGRCKRDKDGNGIFYAGDDLISCLGNDLYVNAWMELPERYREDES